MSASEYVKQLHAEIVEQALEEQPRRQRTQKRLLRVRYR